MQNEIVNRSISADSLESVMDELKRETRAMASPLRLWQVRASSREEGPHVYKQPQVAGVR